MDKELKLSWWDDSIKVHGRDPDRARRQAGSYRGKVETKEGEFTEFIIQLPI